MKFRRSVIYYAVCWFVAFVLFNIVTFVSPVIVKDGEQSRFHSPLFWIAWAIILVSFVAQLAVAVLVLMVKKTEKKSFNLPVFVSSILGLIALIISCSICMVFNNAVSQSLGIVFCFVVLGVTIIAVVIAKAVGDQAGSYERKIAAKTSFIRNLTTDAEATKAKANDNEMKSLCNKVYEAIRFSDPMSNDELKEIEGKIEDNFDSFDSAVVGDDKEKAKETAELLMNLIKERNAKCKMLK